MLFWLTFYSQFSYIGLEGCNTWASSFNRITARAHNTYILYSLSAHSKRASNGSEETTIRYANLISRVKLRLLRPAYTKGYFAGSWNGDNPFVHVYSEDACCSDSAQAGAHEADIGSFLCYSGDSLQEQCVRCDIENWGHFLPASWRSNSN